MNDVDSLLDEALDYVLHRYGSSSIIWNYVKPESAICFLVSLFELQPESFRGGVPTCSFLIFEDERHSWLGAC